MHKYIIILKVCICCGTRVLAQYTWQLIMLEIVNLCAETAVCQMLE